MSSNDVLLASAHRYFTVTVLSESVLVSVTVTTVECDFAQVVFPSGLNVKVGAVLSNLYGPAT